MPTDETDEHQMTKNEWKEKHGQQRLNKDPDAPRPDAAYTAKGQDIKSSTAVSRLILGLALGAGGVYAINFKAVGDWPQALGAGALIVGGVSVYLGGRDLVKFFDEAVDTWFDAREEWVQLLFAGLVFAMLGGGAAWAAPGALKDAGFHTDLGVVVKVLGYVLAAVGGLLLFFGVQERRALAKRANSSVDAD